MSRSPLRTGLADLPHPALRLRICRLLCCQSFVGRRTRGPEDLQDFPPQLWLFRRTTIRLWLPPRLVWPHSFSSLSNRLCFLNASSWPMWFRFLPPFAPRELPRFFATMAALTPARSRRNGFLPAQVSTLPYVTSLAFSPQPSPTARFSPLYEECERKRIWLLPQASPLASRLAAVANRIGFTFVWDRKSASGCSPPRLTTTQLPPAALPLLVSG